MTTALLRSMASRFIGWVGLVTLLCAASACQTFDPPPSAKIVEAENGVMTSGPADPFTVEFSESFVKSSLRLKVVVSELDAEENLWDERPDPSQEEFDKRVVMAYEPAHAEDPERTFGGTFDLSGTTLRITPGAQLAYGVPYLVLLEPGLEDLEGNRTVPRTRLPFTHTLAGGGPNQLPTGYFYFLINVEFAATQIQTYTYMDIDPLTGGWRGIFTNANRLVELNGRTNCPSCDDNPAFPVCALQPTPHCAAKSEKQTALEHYVDFLPEATKPDGYTFIADGFARDEPDGTIALGTAPFLIDIIYGSGNINIRAENSKVTAVFEKDAAGRWVGNGSIAVDVIKLNGNGSSGTKGTLTAMNLFDDEVQTVESFGVEIPTDLGLP